MGIRGVGPERHDGKIVEVVPPGLQLRYYLLLDLVLVRPTHLAHDPRQGVPRDRRDRLGHDPVILELGRRPPRGELRDERRRGDDARAQPRQQLDQTVGYEIKVRHGILGERLHRHAAAPCQRREELMQLLPGREHLHLAREAADRRPVDPVHEQAQRPDRREPDEEAAGQHPRGNRRPASRRARAAAGRHSGRRGPAS